MIARSPRFALAVLLALPLAACPSKDKDGEKKDEKSSKEEKKDEKKSEKKDEKEAKKKGEKGEKKDDESAKKKDDGGDEKGKDDDDGAPKKDDAATASRKIAGVDVPGWAQSPAIADKCKLGPDDEKKLAALQKGEDASLSDGTADLDALKKDIGDGCPNGAPRLAMALNSGGYMRYAKKKYDEADNWWARALVVSPALDVARYNLAAGLALSGKKEDCFWNMQELARAAKAGDAAAANYLEKAKTDADFASVRDDDAFQATLKASQGGLVGPRKEPETAAALPALLPENWKKDTIGDGAGQEVPITYKPTLVDVYTWRPDESTELLVGRVADSVDDIKMIGKPCPPETNGGYGGIVVLKNDGGKYTLLFSKKVGQYAPSDLAGGPDHSVLFTYDYGQYCAGREPGKLVWKGGKVVDFTPPPQ